MGFSDKEEVQPAVADAGNHEQIRVSDAKTHYEQFQHPNLIDDGKLIDSKGCAGCFWRLDQKWIRPCLIYKYNKRKLENRIDFNDVLEEYNEIMKEIESSMQEGEADHQYDQARDNRDTLFFNMSQRQDKRLSKGGLLTYYLK